MAIKNKVALCKNSHRLIVFIVTLLTTAMSLIAMPGQVYAVDGGYPWIGATQLNASDSDYGYWPSCPSDNTGCMTMTYSYGGHSYGVADPWIYYLRNCTSYLAWKVSNVFGGANISGWGNASTWDNNAAGSYSVYTPSNHTPVIGDIAQWEGTITNPAGHVAYVSAVNNGIASLYEYNAGLDGNFYNTRTTASNSKGTPDHYIHIGDNPSTGPFISSPTSYVDSSNIAHSYVTTSGGLNHYVKTSSGTWAGEVAATDNTLTSGVFAYVDSGGTNHVYARSNGGMNHYTKSTGGWNGAVVASQSGSTTFTNKPTAYTDSSGTEHVYFTTNGGLNHYTNSGSGWSGEVVATSAYFNGSPVAYQDSQGGQRVYVKTTTGINHYMNSGGGWGGEVVATGTFNYDLYAFNEPPYHSHILATTSSGFNHYAKATWTGWQGESRSVTGPNSSPIAFNNSYGMHVFLTTTGGMNHYVKTSSWGSEVVTSDSSQYNDLSAYLDNSGGLNAYISTSGGMNRYVNSGSGWPGEVVTTGN